MKRKLEASVLWNWRKSTQLPEGLSYWFLIIQPRTREIEAIASKIYEGLQPIQNQEPDIEGAFKDKDLVYRLLRFDSTKSPELLKKPFERSIRDPRLYDRENPSLVERYIRSLAE